MSSRLKNKVNQLAFVVAATSFEERQTSRRRTRVRKSSAQNVRQRTPRNSEAVVEGALKDLEMRERLANVDEIETRANNQKADTRVKEAMALKLFAEAEQIKAITQTIAPESEVRIARQRAETKQMKQTTFICWFELGWKCAQWLIPAAFLMAGAMHLLTGRFAPLKAADAIAFLLPKLLKYLN